MAEGRPLVLEERELARPKLARVDLPVEEGDVSRIVEEGEPLGDRALGGGERGEDGGCDALELHALRRVGVVQLHVEDFDGAGDHVAEAFATAIREGSAAEQVERDRRGGRADRQEGEPAKKGCGDTGEAGTGILGDGTHGRFGRDPCLELAVAGADVVELHPWRIDAAADQELPEERGLARSDRSADMDTARERVERKVVRLARAADES